MSELWMLTEHSPFMMGFVFYTDHNRAIVIDGGNPEDMPYLKALIGDRQIAAWILTHPHFDHISGFVREIQQGDIIAQIEKVYYNFPSAKFALECEPEIEPCSAKDFEEIYPKISDKSVVVHPGMQITVDEFTVDFLFCGEERYRLPKPNLAVNESSIAFKVTSPKTKSVLFLGDLGPEGGRDLLKNCGDQIKADIVQMSHHGHSGVTEEVYRAIAPQYCLWCAPDWLWEEEDVEFEPELWGTLHTRKWMDKLNIRKHYVTKDGTQEIPIEREK